MAAVLDWTKYCNGIVSVDPRDRSCVVEPGIVYDELNRAVDRYDLKSGPKPSTHSHCALGGMTGNNACGASAQTCAPSATATASRSWSATRASHAGLLTEDGLDVAALVVGSEGTLATVLHAELDLVPTVAHTAMVVVGYEDIAAAADAVPSLLAHSQPCSSKR